MARVHLQGSKRKHLAAARLEEKAKKPKGVSHQSKGVGRGSNPKGPNNECSRVRETRKRQIDSHGFFKASVFYPTCVGGKARITEEMKLERSSLVMAREFICYGSYTTARTATASMR